MNNPNMFMLILLLFAMMAAGGGIHQRHKRKPLSIALAVVAALIVVGALIAIR